MVTPIQSQESLESVDTNTHVGGGGGKKKHNQNMNADINAAILTHPSIS